MNSNQQIRISAVVLSVFMGCSTVKSLPTHNVEQCSVSPEFRQLVETTLGSKRVLQSGYGLAVFKKSTGEPLCEDYIGRDRIIYPASSIKTLVAIAVLRKVDAGKLQLTDQIAITQSNADIECRKWGCDTFGFGGKTSVQHLLHEMITISNNIATNQLIEVAGGKRVVNETAHLLQADSIKINRRLYEEKNPDPKIKEKNEATAFSLVQVYREVSTGYLHSLSDSSRQYLIGLLRDQKHNSYLNADFPPEIQFFHKTGSTSFSTSDAGFFYKGSDTVVVMAGLQGFKDAKTLREIGRRSLDLVLKLLPRLRALSPGRSPYSPPSRRAEYQTAYPRRRLRIFPLSTHELSYSLRFDALWT